MSIATYELVSFILVLHPNREFAKRAQEVEALSLMQGAGQMIKKDIYIEDLIEQVPESVQFLMKRHIRCIACGEPIWGTLEEAAREKGYSDAEIDQIVDELNQLATQP